jgi:hypothetical protein
MSQAEKALDRLLDDSGAFDRGWKTYEEIDQAVKGLGFIRSTRSKRAPTHRAAWEHPDSEIVLAASMKKNGILPCYIKAIRKLIKTKFFFEEKEQS